MDELIPLLKVYGLPGLIIALVASYVWKVHVPQQQKRLELEQAAAAKKTEADESERLRHAKLVEETIADGRKESQALVTAFRSDVAVLSEKFVGALDKVEQKHAESLDKNTSALNKLADAIRDGGKNGVAHQ